MFGFLKSKSPKEKLEEKYKKLMEESFKLSKLDRKAADAKAAEANVVLEQIKGLE